MHTHIHALILGTDARTHAHAHVHASRSARAQAESSVRGSKCCVLKQRVLRAHDRMSRKLEAERDGSESDRVRGRDLAERRSLNRKPRADGCTRRKQKSRSRKRRRGQRQKRER
eukprot:5272761-Pleurochrysis_carterae.AAC.1